ncbi:MAG: hypothetical protein K0B87_03635 [Candidatus Syntrophosphaera sp.]|nr:hypothetical protein [Candidatus Syntrophosphaera sp.]
MRKALFLPLLLAALLLLGCAGIKPPDKDALLRAELAKWQNFTAEGVVRASHSGLTLHKMFVLSKTQDEARLDILDGGAFGINPSPLVTVYLGDYIAIRSSLLPQLEAFAQIAPDPGKYLKLLADPDSLLGLHGNQIIATGRLDLENTRLEFSDRMRLERISDAKSGSEIRIAYTKRGDPDKVQFSMGRGTSLELLVDHTRYGRAQVTPLPPNQPSPLLDGLLQTLEEMFPEQGEPQP